MKKFFIISFLFIICYSCVKNKEEIEMVYPIPTERQLSWQKLDYYAFIHFNMNTFTNKEWGFGDEHPDQFNPTELDTDQWAKIISEVGMKGIIITAKHHDGFCLWPSSYTDHSVKNSKWRNGEADIIKDLAESCKKYNLKFGVYLSPWDRNHEDYGKPEYISYFRNQLMELLTNYGDIFEVWFDGANGGDGYYGGANEVRKVDKKNYYDWENTVKIVRELQPDAVIFSDAGPDIRWVGNEKGYANQTTWSPILKDSLYPGMLNFNKFSAGQENGTHWIPTETDVSIRPGWYYHPEQDDQVKSVEKLIDIYFNSIGLNSALLLNIPVDTRGLIHENDEASLRGLNNFIESAFDQNLVKKSRIYVESSREKFKPELMIDEDLESFWASPKSSNSNIIELKFDEKIEFDILEISEAIKYGQRIKSFEISIETSSGWKNIFEGSTIGNRRLVRIDSQKTSTVRIQIIDSKGPPLISNIGLFLSN
ncbi:MAG: alpha-L-fucosidase [Flavobacteriaceae bacterium]